uniref:DUF4477 domain-containing protein n=1 Tax=Anopheles atroparvus TaxID=41427 RepID=A0A182IV09_ANOAO
MLDYFYSMKKFEIAAAMVTRFSNLYKLRMRHFAGFRLLRRLNQTLLRIKSMNIAWEILNFSGFLPDVSYIPTEVNLPVRSNLEYLLVRLQGLIKLLMRVVYLAKEVARYQLKHIADAIFFTQNSVSLALMGEVWVLGRTACRQVDQFYTDLHASLPILPETKASWLPKDYRLPASLAQWLGKEYQEEIVAGGEQTASLDTGEDSTILTLLNQGDSDELLEQIGTIAAKAVKKEEQSYESSLITSLPKMMLLEALKEDTGEAVVSNVGEIVDRPVKAGFVATDLDHIRSKFHAKQFIADERAKRAENPMQAITSKVSGAQFNDFHTRLMREFNRLSSADFVALFKEELLALIRS